MRWIWIDRITSFESGVSATAVKNLSWAEDHFADHFPGYSVMPACLILEGLAQTGGILVGEANKFREKVVLAKIPKATFHREAMPGEQLTYEATMVDLRAEAAIVKGRVECGDNLICEAEIFFAHLDQNQSKATFGDHNFVFTGELKYLLCQARLDVQPDNQLPPASPQP